MALTYILSQQLLSALLLLNNNMDTKRIRFGFMCNNSNFFAADTLPSLRVRTIECALSNGKQFVVFTVEIPIKASDVLKAVELFNAEQNESPLTLENFMDGGDIIITFEKGQRFLQHPFYAVIHEAKRISQNIAVVAADGDIIPPPPLVSEWSFDGIPVSHRYKRMSGELASAFVEEAISPSSVKRTKYPHHHNNEETNFTTTTTATTVRFKMCLIFPIKVF